MRKFWILCLLLIISFNFLNAMQLILHNDRVVSGKFVRVDKENIIIFSYEKLVTVSLYTIVTIYDDNKNEISKLDLINLKKGRVNYNNVKEEILITPANVDRTSLIFPGKSNYADINLIGGSNYSGSIEGNDGRSIMVYNSNKNSYFLILHKDIKKIIHNSIDITEEVLSYVNGIDFFLIETFEIINQKKNGIQINEYSEYKKSNHYSLTAGCSFGFSHIIKRKKKEYRYNLKPSGYIKFEKMDKDIKTGYGIGFQFYEIAYSRGAVCYFVPIYFVIPKQAKLLGFKGNLGINLFLANSSYKGRDTILLPGLYIAAGPSYSLSDNVSLEILYTLNNGNVSYSGLTYIFNQSISFGLTFR